MNDARRPEAAGSEADALVAQGDRAALVAMTEDADQFRQEAGIWGLGQLRDARDLPRLAALLGDAYVQEEAQAALIACGPAAEPVLVRALDDLCGSGALCALEALRAVGGPAAVDALPRCLRDGDESVRSWTIEALSEIGERGASGAWTALRGHAAVEADPDLRELLAAVLPGPGEPPGPRRAIPTSLRKGCTSGCGA